MDNSTVVLAFQHVTGKYVFICLNNTKFGHFVKLHQSIGLPNHDQFYYYFSLKLCQHTVSIFRTI